MWKKGILSLPEIVSTSMDLMHDVIEGLTAFMTTVKQKPAISAHYTGAPVRDSSSCIFLAPGCRTASAVLVQSQISQVWHVQLQAMMSEEHA